MLPCQSQIPADRLVRATTRESGGQVAAIFAFSAADATAKSRPSTRTVTKDVLIVIVIFYYLAYEFSLCATLQPHADHPANTNRGPRLSTPSVPPPSADNAPAATAHHEYHRALAGYPRPIARGIGAIVVLLIGYFVISFAVGAVGRLSEVALYGQNVALAGGSRFTPITFIAVFSAPALLVPWSMLVQRWFYDLPAASLISVARTLRPAIIGRTVLYVLPIWAVYFAALAMATPLPSNGALPKVDLAVILAATFVITPLQAAGEEFAFRGVAFRVLGSWPRSSRAGLAVGVAGSSLIFGLLHGTTDPWLFCYYTGFGVAMALLTWLTSGLECSITLHAINNTISTIATLVLTQSGAMPDRSNGAGSAIFLIPLALLAVVVAVVWRTSRRRQLVEEPPGTAGGSA